MNKLEFDFDVTEKLFENRCALNAKRIRVLNHTFLKLCDNFPKIKELFPEEIKILNELDRVEKEIDSQAQLFKKN